ncbi:MAG TPA: hypothetical protein VM511_00240 [Luteolibacter sp.]|nr:hypothetical protein [Luteolibacter sp.]
MDEISVPQAPAAKWVRGLFWVFMLSFAFDYRSSDTANGSSSGIDQMLFLLLWAVSTGGIFILGWKYLLVRPGAWLIALWGLFVAYMACNAILQGVVFAHWFRMLLPLMFLFAGLMNTHIAGCVGIRPAHLVTPVFVAACINVIWRIVQGFLFKGLTLETVRIEVQSPSGNWIAAWIGCAVLLRSRFHWTVLVAVGVLFTGIFITVTRSLLFPVFASAAASMVCFAMGVHWRQFQWSDLLKRLAPVGLAAALGLFFLGAVAVFQPIMIERWNERLFHNAYDRNLTADISYLTRKAEADAIWKRLTVEPYHLLNGNGIGASYDWDVAYMPEISLVIPVTDGLGTNVWSIGHSTWTYSLFSGGIIAFATYASLLLGVIIFSLKAARANASDPGPDQWLAFLPFIATCCVLSETLTSNPFNERLAGITFGVMAGLSQAFFVRASWIHLSDRHRT